MALLPDIVAELAPYEPPPHWGKLFAFNDDDLARRLPRLPDFLELRTTYDPRGKFIKAFIDWHPRTHKVFKYRLTPRAPCEGKARRPVE
jgi:D-arabinono-1,4-lactone oxidase